LYNCYAVENFYSTNYKADWFETGSSEPSFAIADIDPSHNPFAYTNGLTISGDESNAIRNKFPNSSIKPYRNLL
jgi:predicted HAD superfamily hydrolase